MYYPNILDCMIPLPVAFLCIYLQIWSRRKTFHSIYCYFLLSKTHVLWVWLFCICLKEHQFSVLLNKDNLDKAVNSMPKAVVMHVLCVLTQLVPVWQQDGGAVKYMRQGCLDELPAGDALDGLRQGRRQPVELVLNQHPFKGLGRQPEKRRKETSTGN